MKTVQEYRRHAEECRRLAANARSLTEREAILAIAQSWEVLAENCERRINTR